MTIFKTILICALFGAFFGLVGLHGPLTLIPAAVCGFLFAKRRMAQSVGKP